MVVYTIRENPLNDDTLYMADEGKIFKGGYVAVLEYFTYANEWSDHKHYRRFRTMEAAFKWVDKNYTIEEIENAGF